MLVAAEVNGSTVRQDSRVPVEVGRFAHPTEICARINARRRNLKVIIMRRRICKARIVSYVPAHIRSAGEFGIQAAMTVIMRLRARVQIIWIIRRAIKINNVINNQICINSVVKAIQSAGEISRIIINDSAVRDSAVAIAINACAVRRRVAVNEARADITFDPSSNAAAFGRGIIADN